MASAISKLKLFSRRQFAFRKGCIYRAYVRNVRSRNFYAQKWIDVLICDHHKFYSKIAFGNEWMKG